MANIQNDRSGVSIAEAIRDDLTSLRARLGADDERVARAEADSADSERLDAEDDARDQRETLDVIAKFVRRIAYACNDTRLLGIATLVIEDLATREDAEFERSHRREQTYEEARREFRDYWDAHKRVCSTYLAEECVQVGTEKYRAMIEDHIAEITPEQLVYMHRYFDESTALKLIAFKVRDRLANKERRLPTRQEYNATMEKELAAFHRRAHQYLSQRLPAKSGDASRG
ncbi:MAG: hypothetical protein ABI560_01395 [Myxococcales bacterium]